MIMKDKIIGAIAVIALVMATIGLVGGNQSASFGGITNYDALSLTEGLLVNGSSTLTTQLKVGASGTTHTKFLSGTCNVYTSDLPFIATSTSAFACLSATGVASGDKVFVALPNINADTSQGLAGGFSVVATYATTANAFGFDLHNNFGASTSSFPLATTSVQYWIIDN